MTSQDHCRPLHLRKKPRDDDEPKGSLSSFTLEKKKNDDEPLGLSSSSIFEEKTKKQWGAFWFVIFYN